MSTAPSPLVELDDVAVVFDAPAHSARRQILLVLLARGESMTSKEVAERFSTTWATVSRHLKTLEAARLVRVVESKDGRERHYQLDGARLVDVAGGWIERFAWSQGRVERDGADVSYWKMRDRRSGLFSTGGIDADFGEEGRTFVNKIGVKGSLFHYVYGFEIDDDGVRRFRQRRPGDSIDDYEAVRFHDDAEVEVVPGRQMFTRNQLLNKEDRILDDLTPAQLAAENRKQF